MEPNIEPTSVKGNLSRPESKPQSDKTQSPTNVKSTQRTPSQQDVPKTAQKAPSKASLQEPKSAHDRDTPQQEISRNVQKTPSRAASQVPNTAQMSPQKAPSHIGSRPASQAPKLTPQLGTPVLQTASNAPGTAASQVPKTARTNVAPSQSGSQIPRTAQQVPKTASIVPQSAKNTPQPSIHPSRVGSQSQRVETASKPPPSGYQASKVGSQVPGATQVPPGSRLDTIGTRSQVPKTASRIPPTGSKITAGSQIPKTARTQVPTAARTGYLRTNGHSQRQSNRTGTNRTKIKGQTRQRTRDNATDEGEEEEEEEYEGEYYDEVEDFGEYGYDGDDEGQEDAERAAIIEPLDYNRCDCFPRLSRPGGHSMVYDQLRCEHNELTGYQHKGAIRFQDNWDDDVARSVRKKKYPERPPRKRTILGYPPTELSFPRKGERRVNYMDNPDDEQYEYEEEDEEDEDKGYEEANDDDMTSGTRQQSGDMELSSTAAGKTRAKTGQSLQQDQQQQQIEEDINNILPPIGIHKPQSQAMSRSYHSQQSLPAISPNGNGRMTVIEEQSERSSRATQQSRATASYNLYSEDGSYIMQNSSEVRSRASAAPSIVIPERQPFQGKAYDPVTKQVYNYYVDTTGRNWEYNRTLDI